MRPHSNPDQLVHVYLRQTNDHRDIGLTVTPAAKQRLTEQYVYKRLTEHPRTRAEIEADWDQLKQQVRPGKLHPISYFVTVDGLHYTVRQVQLEPSPLDDAPIKLRKRKPASAEVRARMSSGQKGRPKSAKHKAAISAANKGRKRTEEQIANMRAGHAARREARNRS